MKVRTLILISIVTFALVGSGFAEDDQLEFLFPAIPVVQLIGVYQKQSAHKKLTISTSARANWNKKIQIKFNRPKPEALKFIRKKLAEETGITLTEFEDRLSVTYNDQFDRESELPPPNLPVPLPKQL
jgi:hypothetical protein